MAKIHLTQPALNSAHCPDGQRKIQLFDAACKGLLAEIRSSGGKTFYLRYRDARSKLRQVKIADSKDVSLAQARALANKLRTQIAMGQDPLEEKAVARQSLTFAQFIDQKYLPFVKTYKRSWQTDVSLLNNHLFPASPSGIWMTSNAKT